MKTNEQKAFDFAADTTKQLISLATGIIALTITFSKDIIGASELSNSSLIFWSWGLFIFSVFCGIWTLMALTGNLQPMIKTAVVNEEKDNINDVVLTENVEQNVECNINTKNVKIPSVLQILSFLVALILTVLFGIGSIKNNSEKKVDCGDDCLEIIKKTEYKLIDSTKTEKILIAK